MAPHRRRTDFGSEPCARTVCGRFTLALVFAFAAALGAHAARADDPPAKAPEKPPPTFAEVALEHKSAVDAGDVNLQARLLLRLCDLASKVTADPKDDAAGKQAEENRKTARSLCRKALASREEELVMAALGGYETLRLAGSSADLKAFVDAKLGEKRALRQRLAAVAAWGAIHDAGSYETLLDLLRLPHPEPEKQRLAVAAAKALAEYKAIAKGGARYEFLREYMQTFDTIHDSAYTLASAASADWWNVLHPVMSKTFSALTGAMVKDHDACTAWWRDNRRKVQAGNE